MRKRRHQANESGSIRPPIEGISLNLAGDHIAAAQRQTQIYQFFLLVFTIVGILFIISPKEAQSVREKRTLQQLPALSFERIFNGTFAKEVELYYVDQFPAREPLIGLSDGIERNMTQLFGGKDSIQIIQVDRGDGGTGAVATPQPQVQAPANEQDGANIQDPATSDGAVLQGTKDGSATPNDPASSDAAVGTSDAANAGGTSVSLAPEPTKELPNIEVGEMQYNSGQIIIVGGQAMELFYYNRDLNVNYAKRINRLVERLPAESVVSSIFIPSSIAFYGPEEFRTEGYSNIRALETVQQVLLPSVKFINVYDALRPYADEYLYFRTDHHWTGRGAYYAYKEFARQMGYEVRPLDAYELKKPEGTFLGSLYNYTNQNPLLTERPDQGEFFFPEHTVTHTRYSGAAMDDPKDTLFLAYDFPGDGHYALYAEGDYPLVVAESSLKNGRSILVIKDSFANAFYPYLVDMYEKVYVIDPRFFSDPLVPFIEAQGIKEVVFVNGTFTAGIEQWYGGYDAIVPPKE